jgi:hypothetical protein
MRVRCLTAIRTVIHRIASIAIGSSKWDPNIPEYDVEDIVLNIETVITYLVSFQVSFTSHLRGLSAYLSIWPVIGVICAAYVAVLVVFVSGST